MNLTNSSEHPSNTYEVDSFTLVFLSFAYGIISFLSVAGNILIILAIRPPRMHNVTNYFILNLALADIVIGLFATPFQFQAALLQRWVFPEIMCKIAPFSATLSVNVSIITLVAVSIERYNVIIYPFKAQLRFKHCMYLIVLIWIISILLSSIHLYNFEINTFDSNTRCLPSKNPLLFEYHTIFLVFSQYVIPFIIITFTYSRIAYQLFTDETPSSITQNHERNKRKVIKMMFIVVVIFMTCWFPLQLYNLLSVLVPNINEYEYIHIIWFFSHWFAMSNSCFNVFIYGACSVRFKSEFRSIFSFLPCLSKEIESNDPVINYKVYELQIRKRLRTTTIFSNETENLFSRA